MSRALILISLLTMNGSSVYAAGEDTFADRGLYLTGQAGFGAVNSGFLDGMFGSMELSENLGFSGRIGLGYQLNRYFSVESGIGHYPSAVRSYDSAIGLFGFKGLTGTSDINNVFSADLMGALRIPMGKHIFIGAGAGVAVTHFSYSAINVTNSAGTVSVLAWSPGSAVFFAPKAELRVGAKLNKKVSVYVSGSSIFSVNGNDLEVRNYQPSITMIAMGVNYSF